MQVERGRTIFAAQFANGLFGIEDTAERATKSFMAAINSGVPLYFKYSVG